jgi:glutamate-ammonia-ligase adenylyltransferase
LVLLAPEKVTYPRRKEGLAQEAKAAVAARLAQSDYTAALQAIRMFRQREILRIAARDLAGLAQVPEIVRELSDLADVCLNQVWHICYVQLTARHGRPYHQNEQNQWQETSACVLGMGKLGGQELNYSSDVDLLFVYSEEGSVFKEPPGKGKNRPVVLKNHQFFNAWRRCSLRKSPFGSRGSLYRVDMRLRPEGDYGPLTRSLAGYENFYAQWGQTWERMMLIKARGVAGDDVLAAEFLEMVQPFRYPRSIQSTILQEVASMKDRIEQEVVRAGEMERNVKLGAGAFVRLSLWRSPCNCCMPGASLPAKRANPAVPRKARRLRASQQARGPRVGRSLQLSACRRASAADGGQPPDPHDSHGAPRPGAVGQADELCQAWRVRSRA